jgi:hypothetical protein
LRGAYRADIAARVDRPWFCHRAVR